MMHVRFDASPLRTALSSFIITINARIWMENTRPSQTRTCSMWCCCCSLLCTTYILY